MNCQIYGIDDIIQLGNGHTFNLYTSTRKAQKQRKRRKDRNTGDSPNVFGLKRKKSSKETLKTSGSSTEEDFQLQQLDDIIVKHT